MSFSRLLRKFSQPSLAHSNPTGAESRARASANDLNEPPRRRHASESMPSIPRPWRRKRPLIVDSSQSQLASTSPVIPQAENPAPDDRMTETLPTPPPTTPGVSANLVMPPPPEIAPAISPMPDTLAEVWDIVKDRAKVPNVSLKLGAVDGTAATTQSNAAPFLPIIKATVVAAGQTDMGKAIKEGIGKLSESMPVFMNALDELKALHPFIGVAVLAFQTVYTLEQKRRDNDKKIMALFVGMKDMMGALLLLKGVENDKLTAPDGTSIEDRLKLLVERTADDIKICSNVCDAYVKKRLLAKVLLCTLWDAKLLEFVNLFATRRQDFEFELTLHTSQGIDKANTKLDVIGDATKALNEQMDAVKALFQQLVSSEQKKLSDLVDARGGLRALKDDDKILRDLEKAEKALSTSKAEVSRARREKPKDTPLTADESRRDILEDPKIAVEKNLAIFTRKFEAQKNQIVDELTLVVKRESDRVIQEVKGGPHERILDRLIHEIWTEMGWRGNVKARHFVLALRDHYQEKLEAGNDNILGMGVAGIHCSPDPDAWAIKYIDIIRLQPILESIDDDGSGFITIGEINRFTASRPIEWSLPHWVAFWAVGYRASLIDYAHRIEDLLAKMDGVRSEVLPLNFEAIVNYLSSVWQYLHTLTTPVLSLQPSQDDPDKFKSYIEAEEARLESNLRAVDYIIDGTDTLTLITGVGRVEKTVLPLLYLLMKHHYEVMRIMRTKIVDPRELSEGVKSISSVADAVTYRMEDLTNSFSQQKLDIEKQFQNCAYGIFKYVNNPKSLWSGDYHRNLEPRTTPYDDVNEDQNIKLEDVLKFKTLDEPSLAYWVYDGHSIDDSPTHHYVEPPLKDILGHWNGYFYASGGVRETEGVDSMMTLVIEPAEGEQDFNANGWSNRGSFTVTGSWSKDENDVLQIKFKISFKFLVINWTPIYFDGHFDHERNTLTGVWDFSSGQDSSVGPMEFRRIPPRYLTVYPSIHDLSTNKPNSLWKFAITVVRNDIRQEHCSWSYLSQRRDDRRMVISSSVRVLFFGKPLDVEEASTLCDAVQRLTPADACFYGSIIDHKRAYTLIHGSYYCDSCGGIIGGVRLFCLDCIEKEGNNFDTLDLCCAPESRCIEERVTYREDMNGPHEPYHKLVKLRTVVMAYQLGRARKVALAAFERVEEFCAKIAKASQDPREEEEMNARDASVPESKTAAPSSETVKQADVPAAADDTRSPPEAELTTTTESLSKNDKSDDISTAANGSKDEAKAGTEDKVGKVDDGASKSPPQNVGLPTCGKCNGALSFPFWYCILCEDNLFICDACDSNGVPELTRSSGNHTKEHHLIRCMAPRKCDEAVPAAEQRLMSIEGRLDELSSRMEDLTGRIGNIEQLLHKLVGAADSGNGAAQS